jgi:hypothetical protein
MGGQVGSHQQSRYRSVLQEWEKYVLVLNLHIRIFLQPVQ